MKCLTQILKGHDISLKNVRNRTEKSFSLIHSFIIIITNHEGARHCRKPLGRRKGFDIFITLGLTKIRAFVYKCGQKISTSVGFTKIRAFAGKCG